MAIVATFALVKFWLESDVNLVLTKYETICSACQLTLNKIVIREGL